MIDIYEIGSDNYWTGAVTQIDLTAGAPIGWTRTIPPALASGQYAHWAGGSWAVTTTAPPVVIVVPAAVTMRAARLALLYAGLLAQVDAYIASIPGIEGEAARVDWATAQTVERASPLVAQLQQVLQMTDAQIDALFVDAEARQ